MNACVSALARLLRSRLAAEDYPAAARKADVQGSVWFVLTCNSRGEFEGSWVERSSGSELLDQSALRTVERAFPVGAPVATPPVPPFSQVLRHWNFFFNIGQTF